MRDKNKEIRVSIIIPVYNAKEYLKQCLDSVLGQTLKEIQVICIDDGSTDGSYKVLQQYEKECENIIVLKQTNKGAGTARNLGIQYAEGEFVCFLDADDYYYDDHALDKLYYASIHHNSSICGGNIVSLDNGTLGKCILPTFNQEKCLSYKEFQDYYYYPRFIFSRKLLIENQIEFPAYRRFQDPLFMMRAMLAARQLYVLEDSVYVYRTGHKEPKTSREIAIEVLTGIKDCFLLAKENDLTRLYEMRLKSVLDEHFSYYAKFAYEHEENVCGLLSQINEINRQWLGEKAIELMTEEKLIKVIEGALQEREELLEKCHAFTDVIIYGAGMVGSYFLDNYEKECENIVGIAVSDKENNEDSLGEFKIRAIEAYDSFKETALVVVAVGAGSRKDVLNKLTELGFTNAVCVDYRKLLMLKRVGA